MAQQCAVAIRPDKARTNRRRLDPARELVETAIDPRQELLLGYWAEILDSSDNELTSAREASCATAASATTGDWIRAARRVSQMDGRRTGDG